MPQSDSDAPWTWKVHDGDGGQPGLLYEPGNWGDVLKGTWAVAVTEELCRKSAEETFRYADPFAGAAAYPATRAAVSRLEFVGSGIFVRAQAPWTERGELASTALLVGRRAEEAGKTALLEVFDSDAARRETWLRVPAARPLETANGYDWAAAGRTDAALVLIDPYDFFDRSEILPGVARAARGSWVLVYLYNRAPRGGGHARTYGSLRRSLAELHPYPVLAGRIPSDLVLPRAFHEVWLLGPESPPVEIRRRLFRATKSLACKMSTAGSTEILGEIEKMETEKKES